MKIGFKNEKADKENYLNVGDFDLIIDTIKGSDILDSLNDHKYNIYLYPGGENKKRFKLLYYMRNKIQLFQTNKRAKRPKTIK